jgi:ATP-dependent Clp protease ATP-binding subunit ClpA
MIVRLLMHVRPAPLGNVVVTPMDFPSLAKHARSLEEAVQALRPALSREIHQRSSALERAPLVEAAESELLRVPIDVQPRGGQGETVSITLGIVVTPRAVSGKATYLVRSPVVRGFEGVIKERDKVPDYVAREAPASLRYLRAPAILAADEPLDSHLEVVELNLPEPVQEHDDDDDEDESVLEHYGQDLTAKASHVLARIDRRQGLVSQVLATLGGPGRSSVLLVGPLDVGKTALVHEIAGRLASGDVPPNLAGRRMFRITANELIAGARYTGMWQDRFRRLVNELRESRAIADMEDVRAIIDAGRWSESQNNASNVLRPYIESGDITVICEATIEQLTAAQIREPSFIEAFHRIEVVEPGIEDVRGIAADAASRLAQGAQIDITPDAVDAAIELTRRFQPYRGYPGKAVRLLQSAVRDRQEGVERLDRGEVTRVFAARSGLPLVLLSDDVQLNVANVRDHFASRVLGQPEATAAVVDLVAVLKAGLNAPGKPLGSLFFVGPTGVGKTELVKVLAEFLFGGRDRVIRFDMGEYASTDAVPKLIGSGWQDEDDGELTRRIREQPFSVVLLDEIEKAHASVFDALLALLGEGRLTSASGKTTYFDNAIVIMTSNLGASRSRAPTLGFAAEDPASSRSRLERHYVEQAEAFFRPEFMNRIDRFVVFHPLDEPIVRQIARRELGKLLIRDGIVRRRLLVEVDDPVIDVLAERGTDTQRGARPLQRVIERAVIEPLARVVVERQPQAGSLVRVRLEGGDVVVDVQPIREAEPPPAPRPKPRAAGEEGTFARAIEATRALAAELDEEETTSPLVGLRGEVSALIVKTHDPAFWDDKDSARTTLARVYQLEQVLDRFDAVHQRGRGLSGLAQQIAVSRARDRLGEIWRALDELRDSLSVIRLEIAGALAGGGPGALVSVVPIGKGADDWASEVFAMYCSWAERTGRQISPVDGRAHAVRIEGLATLELLQGEAGLHRRIHADRDVFLARVTVSPLAEDGVAERPIDSGQVVRVYEEGRRQIVRDPRTATKDTRLSAVLRDGKIDAFLLAWLRLQRDRGAVAAKA